MIGSERFLVLLQQVGRLRQLLLPIVFDPTGTYEDPEQAHLNTVSFRILVHAEIESYLEDRVLEIAETSWRQWLSGLSSLTVVSLCVFSGKQFGLPPEEVPSPKGNRTERTISFEDRVKSAYTVFRAALPQNHGIKEEHVLRLLLPIGIRMDDLPATLLADLSSFGGARGEVAHRTHAVGRVVQFLDPRLEFERVEKLCSDLFQLDVLFEKLQGLA